MILHRDIETRGMVSLQQVGTWKYAADPGTEVLCCAYATRNDPVRLWRPDEPVPPEFLEAARDPSWLVVAHNDQFETAIEHLILHRRYGWPIVPIKRTAARWRSHWRTRCRASSMLALKRLSCCTGKTEPATR
jgi:hypothetical protein